MDFEKAIENASMVLAVSNTVFYGFWVVAILCVIIYKLLRQNTDWLTWV